MQCVCVCLCCAVTRLSHPTHPSAASEVALLTVGVPTDALLLARVCVFVYVCVSQVAGSGTQVRMMVEMLESYDREVQSLEGSINEAEEDLDNTR